MTYTPKFSVIICSVDPVKFARANICYESLLENYPHEVIGIHDAKSLAEGYNRGIEQSTGDILIFSHDDILIDDSTFAAKIAERLKHFDLLGVAGTTKLITATLFGAGQPHIHGAICHVSPGEQTLNLNIYGAETWPIVENIQAIDGVCMATTRALAKTLGFDAETFDGFQLYDLDFSFRAYRSGRRLAVCCDIPVLQESSGNFAYPHQYYAERFLLKFIEQMGQTKAEEICTEHPGRRATFHDYRTLVQAWRADIFARATLAMRRISGK